MRRLVLVRHGETDWNVAGRLQGASDIPLNDNGREQARAAAPDIARQFPVSTVFSSQLSRAVETATIIADAMGARVVVDERLQERAYGVWEGLSEEERCAEHPDENDRWERGEEPRIEGYESHVAVCARAMAAIDELTAADGTHVIVSHGSTTRVLVTALLGVPLGGRAIGTLGNVQWAELVSEHGGPWVLRSLNARALNAGVLAPVSATVNA